MSNPAIPEINGTWTLFLDRDGVLNRKLEGDYVKHLDELEMLPGAAEAVALANQRFGNIFLVTNQAGIGKGLMTEADLATVHEQVRLELAKAGARLAAIYHCPHRPDAGCECRKPRTGMPLRAQREFAQVNFQRSVMVGDSASDLEMGRALGMVTVLIGAPWPDKSHLFDFHYPSLRQWADEWIAGRPTGKPEDIVFTADYWNNRYLEKASPWDLGKPSAPLMAYMAQWTDKSSRILLPGGGGGHEAAALHQMGFTDVHLLDWSPEVIATFLKNYPDFPATHTHCEDFFSHAHTYDLVLEQTFFCALPVSMRDRYVEHMARIIRPGGRLAGVMFCFPLVEAGPPWGGDAEEYRRRFAAQFDILSMQDCPNSEPSRAGRELWVELRRK